MQADSTPTGRARVGLLSNRHVLLLPLLLVSTLALPGCATRMVGERLIYSTGLEVDLIHEVKGFETQPRDYEHPAIISKTRMLNILNAVEVETRKEGEAGVIRQPAFHPEIVERTAVALVEAFAAADPNQEIGLKVVRKERRLGVFHTKYLTSFLAYIDDGYLYLLLDRIDWRIPQADESKDLPDPVRGRAHMDFRVVSGQHLFYAGPQALEIAWQDPVFREAYRLPGSTDGERRRREILEESPVPRDEQEAAMGTEGTLDVDQLSADQLRALADLEDDRRAGRITETAYQRAKRELLRKR
jgi:hypothetical protein